MAELNQDLCVYDIVAENESSSVIANLASVLERQLRQMVKDQGHPDAPIYTELSKTKRGTAIVAAVRPRIMDHNGRLVSKES